ncbi:hypothetical protein A1Q1_05394 [Trichosporon asahii var. asahii CBS 2479]|uniref:Uncharacterized protein n=1 Tax=Trichosporon asahii var. asahii (strain ATCC 90039 / CBS 2479 / JCM 2466 / KCTC 7840 / NBRC 103889/ NCYC 2677 / UAMH 7654) TaxID=1186058 RepID=J6ENV4_TRIAS|nr:hypothetical protein A1Q1_05394 [Trichosporon asahii var. asahii CBS 2479]EJT46064.1 hypothetical protein A1Q1_05394 [Trichosporon asahii var. asahii CBS 2479]
MFDARCPPGTGLRGTARGPHPERPGRRSFQEWLDLTTEIVREVYASALSILPPEYQGKAPPLPRVGTFCRNVMNAEWYPVLDSWYYPGSYEMLRPIPLEELGICNPMADGNLSDVQECARVGHGWEEPPPFELPVPEDFVEEIELSEDEFDKRLAELQQEAHI